MSSMTLEYPTMLQEIHMHLWRRAGLTFCFVGLALMVLPVVIAALSNPRLLLNVVPFFVLLAIWFVAFFLMRKLQQGQLQHEIDKQGQLQREIDELRLNQTPSHQTRDSSIIAKEGIMITRR